jgi:hypothetical protein
MNRSYLLSRVIGAVVALTVVSTGLPAFAAESGVSSWFTTQKEFLRQKLDSAPPITFKFIGDRIVPVFVKQAPKYVVIVESIDAPGAGGTTARAMR